MRLPWRYSNCWKQFQFAATDSINTLRVHPRKPENEKKLTRPLKRDAITELFERGDSPSLKPNHTLLGRVRRRHEMDDDRQTNEPGPTRGWNRVWFGTGADLKLRAVRQAEVLAHEWAS